MQKHTLFKSLFISLILLTVISYFGCEKKAEESKQTEDGIKSENVLADTSASVSTPESDPTGESKIKIPDMKGTWTGTFDGKPTTLNITEQVDSSFSGKITINYKQTLNQDVKGNFSPTALKISMADLIHSKYMGKYDGKFSADHKNFSGTFTKNRDNSKYSFNLNKK